MTVQEKVANIWVMNRGYVESLLGKWLILETPELMNYQQFHDLVSSFLVDARKELNMEQKNPDSYHQLEIISEMEAVEVDFEETPAASQLWEMMGPRFTKSSVVATIIGAEDFLNLQRNFEIEFSSDDEPELKYVG